MNTLSSFVVLKKLAVHNIRVEPRKVRADYTVEKFSGERERCELIYSYDNRCFEPNSGADINLASMMLVQVALNYGLFCETIEFDGLFDDTDRKFLRAMLDNTSKEILTNKLLIDNPFFLPEYRLQKVERMRRYTQADLVFTNSDYKGVSWSKEREVLPDYSHYAILSSGGKDSLLTYGIVKELGNPHPIFINEAGRHWFTAVNSYKYFKEIEPNTEKPWCNSDRVFNWMLKQLPFIRKNYASIRADIYPVRLWTVAVFLFGVLPIVRKKNIGNILIGNEYDTTVIVRTVGIENYNGLYDQSKFFDNALSRYYQAKGWRIYQYSLLRSMSELLILKMLAERYPHLQQHQVSCHAAHKSGDRMYPCGKCEKCRRIVGMLTALGFDPRTCGYSEQQTAAGLGALEQKTVKQIGSDAAHLYHLLLSGGHIAENRQTKKWARKHQEITCLRFDGERSTLADLPEHVRKPLFGLLTKYADDTVVHKERRWQHIDLDDHFLSSTPYKFN